jgi:hypothetical protein
MPVRETMADLIERLRTLIADKSGADQVFSDEDLQDFLDAHRVEHFYIPLTAVPTVAAGGGVTTTRFTSGALHDWEEDAELFGPDFERIEPAVSDWRRGIWTFEEDQPEPVRISGRTYDLFGSGADALECWAAKIKVESDLKTGDFAFARLPRVQAILSLAETLRRRQSPVTATIRRSDLC